MKRSKFEYENDIAAMLVGKRLTGVRYFEIRYDSDRPFYRDEPFPGHLLDYGCDLEIEDGSIFGIIWDSEYFQYGVGVFKLSLSSQLTDVRVWDVTSENHWASLIGKTITKVKVYWSWVQYEGHEKQDYPQDVELEFEDGSVVFFSASQYNKDKDRLWGMSDDIAVVFGRDSAKRYGIGPYANNG
jgi:hypothetical protein